MSIETASSSISLWPLAVLVFLIVLVAIWQRTRNWTYCGICAGFGIYCLVAIHLLFFPIRIVEGMTLADSLRFGGINLIPLWFNFSELPQIVLLQILQNMLLTVPFGFGISLVLRRQPKHILGLALALGLSIELIQAGIGVLLGYFYRIVDVNDVLLNALGVLIGYGAWQVLKRIAQRTSQKYSLSST
jgi:glycopeptide antibiotics resistance protein